MVRVHKNRPLVHIFIFARTNELVNSPAQNAMSDASTTRQVFPKIIGYASCPFQSGAAGILTTIQLMRAAKINPPNPDQITRRERAYPYTSVSISPNR